MRSARPNARGCEKEIQKLESELSKEQVLAAQLRAREEFQFRPPDPVLP
jgi:hypothetical protein